MKVHRCLGSASKSQPCLLIPGRRTYNGDAFRPLMLIRGKHVNTQTDAQQENAEERLPFARKPPSRKISRGDTPRRNHQSQPKAAATFSAIDLKLSELQEVARTLGVSQTAPKPALIARLQDVLRNHCPPPADARILSIDLGIRNLAYALLTTPASPGAPKPTVHAWNRLDLRSLSTISGGHDSLRSHDFSPPSLANLALILVQNHLLPLNPTHVLIEKQRFRSGGGSAVLEWTVRVNSLESMLYAIFATLKSLGRFSGEVIPIDPRRVGPFLLGDEVVAREAEEGGSGRKNGGVGRAQAKGSKENKKLKIGLVGRWLRDGRGVDFEGEGKVMRNAFLMRWLPKEKKTKVAKEDRLRLEEEKSVDKLDDVADCLLQGVAWLKWEENKRKLVEEIGHGL